MAWVIKADYLTGAVPWYRRIDDKSYPTRAEADSECERLNKDRGPMSAATYIVVEER